MGAQIDWASLGNQARVAREQAYAPYSRFAMGAALLCGSDEVYLGCDVQNISVGLTICAERIAVTNAIQAGSRRLFGIAIAADTTAVASRGDARRQFLAEFGRTLPIYAVGLGGVSYPWLLSELLPSPFGDTTAECT